MQRSDISKLVTDGLGTFIQLGQPRRRCHQGPGFAFAAVSGCILVWSSGPDGTISLAVEMMWFTLRLNETAEQMRWSGCRARRSVRVRTSLARHHSAQALGCVTAR